MEDHARELREQTAKAIGRDLLCDRRVHRHENRGQFLDQMRAVARFLQLLNHRNHNIIADAFGIDFGGRAPIHRRGWRGVLDDSPAGASQRVLAVRGGWLGG